MRAHPTSSRLFGAAPTRTVLALLLLLLLTASCSNKFVPVVVAFQPRPAPTRTRPLPSSVVFSSVQLDDAAATDEAASSPPPHPYEYDLAVIGGGPVGVQAAIAAASLKNTGQHHTNNVVLIDAPRASGALMNEDTQEDLSLGGPTGLFSKALRYVLLPNHGSTHRQLVVRPITVYWMQSQRTFRILMLRSYIIRLLFFLIFFSLGQNTHYFVFTSCYFVSDTGKRIQVSTLRGMGLREDSSTSYYIRAVR